jgi:MFS transporter, NNP family, nitrate/nitrite transporter
LELDDFRKAGHWPTLVAAFLYFCVSFMAWMSLGPLMIYVTREMQLSVEDKVSLAAVPVLGGAFLRLPVGLIADVLGSKITGVAAQLVVLVAVALVYIFGLAGPLAITAYGVSLGVAGASFAVALPQVSRWYPSHYQGVAMGIVGAGNVGVVLDQLMMPWIAENYGWQTVYGVLLIPLAAALVFYIYAARDAPARRVKIGLSEYTKLLLNADSWWFVLLYFITFGGFVGLASIMPLYFNAQYHAAGVAAGLTTGIIAAFGTGFRPIGGYIADRIGGVKTLSLLLGVISAGYFMAALLPGGPSPTDVEIGWSLSELPAIAWAAVALFSIEALCLGMGNGAVFQLLPLCFGAEIGFMTGLVGAAGGLGGYLLAKVIALSKAETGEFTWGFIILGLVALFGLAGLFVVRARWRATWGEKSGANI